MNKPTLLLLQSPGSAETRAVRTAAMVVDIPVANLPIERLHERADALRGGVMPVGSVEYVRAAMEIAGIQEPANLSYPDALEALLRRHVRQTTAGNLLGTWFVKPCTTKSFTGFVFDTLKEPEHYSEHDREQYEAFMALPPDTPVWVSEPVSFVSEWRYYVLDGQVLGSSRYDPDGAEEAPAPDPGALASAVAAMSECHDSPIAYALDLGVLDSGETALVEVNDAWAIGYYGQGIDPKDYLRMLCARWGQLHPLNVVDTTSRARRPRL